MAFAGVTALRVFFLPSDEHHRAEEICSELPRRTVAVQYFITITVGMLAECHGGVRALARAMGGPDGRDCEPTVRRWLALPRSEPRAIIQLNPIVAHLAKFSRSETGKSRRRIRSESGPVGDRQAVLAYVSLLNGAEKPVVPTPEETLVLPVALVATRLFGGLVCQIAERLRKGEVFAPRAPPSMPQFPSRPSGHSNTPCAGRPGSPGAILLALARKVVIALYMGVDGKQHAVLSNVSDPTWRKTISMIELEKSGHYARVPTLERPGLRFNPRGSA